MLLENTQDVTTDGVQLLLNLHNTNTYGYTCNPNAHKSLMCEEKMPHHFAHLLTTKSATLDNGTHKGKGSLTTLPTSEIGRSGCKESSDVPDRVKILDGTSRKLTV